ncbi:hypothetical protein HPB49_022685 [Dermacentor silvarum]|uniref:Uncharacterized protein n=1 Tax=Dermacentor silvarum TaxID=543639 RepID=A0ACB8DLB9_DERSI|nr:hypothetical protein HPB49_022685 [Dermacentor silvarum]
MPEQRGAGEWRKGLVVKNRIVKASRMPPMPEEHIKIVIRPRGGLNFEIVSPPTVGRAIVEAAGLSTEQTKEHVICPNFMQNILVASTPERSNAERHVRLRSIRVADKDFEERARAELATAAAEASQLASAPQGSPRRRSRSRSRSRSKQRPSSGTPATRSRSVSREARVRFPAAGGGGGTAGGQTTWADEAKGGISTGRARQQSQEHVYGNRDKERIAQLKRENRSLKAAVDRLVKEIAELKRGLPSGKQQ